MAIKNTAASTHRGQTYLLCAHHNGRDAVVARDARRAGLWRRMLLGDVGELREQRVDLLLVPDEMARLRPGLGTRWSAEVVLVVVVLVVGRRGCSARMCAVRVRRARMPASARQIRSLAWTALPNMEG